MLNHHPKISDIGDFAVILRNLPQGQLKRLGKDKSLRQKTKNIWLKGSETQYLEWICLILLLNHLFIVLCLFLYSKLIQIELTTLKDE